MPRTDASRPGNDVPSYMNMRAGGLSIPRDGVVYVNIPKVGVSADMHAYENSDEARARAAVGAFSVFCGVLSF